MRPTATVTLDLDVWRNKNQRRQLSPWRLIDYLYRNTPEGYIQLTPAYPTDFLPYHFEVKVHHHHLLSGVNLHPANCLINIDLHDDLADGVELSEGNWASMVNWAPKAKYFWVTNDYEGYHTCGDWPCGVDKLPGTELGTKWTTCSRKRGLKKDMIPWLNKFKIIYTGICLSPGYTEAPMVANDLIRFLRDNLRLTQRINSDPEVRYGLFSMVGEGIINANYRCKPPRH